MKRQQIIVLSDVKETFKSVGCDCVPEGTGCTATPTMSPHANCVMPVTLPARPHSPLLLLEPGDILFLM